MNVNDTCPVCGSRSTKIFLNRQRVPVHQNLVLADQKSAVEISKENLNLAFCGDCGFIFNKTFDLSKLDYGDKYDNTQDYSPFFNAYLSDLAHSFIFEKNVRNCRIVEVGCGKGSFLRKLTENREWGNVGYGFDPSYSGPESDMDGRLKFVKRYYDSTCINFPADVVVCRHVIEHVTAPITLLRTIRETVINSPNAHVFFETPNVEWILHNKVIWDFFYEHCSLFTKESLTTALEVAGFRVENVKNVFGGQYILLEGTVEHKNNDITKKVGHIPLLAKQFAESENELRRNWRDRVQRLGTKGRVAIWGAGAKGVTFANLIDPDRKWIDCIIDLNPKKQGKYVPGTGHPIVSYKEIKPRGIKTAILMNPNYFCENLGLLNKENIRIDLVQ